MNEEILMLFVFLASFGCIFTVPVIDQIDASFNDVEADERVKINPTVYAVQGVETCRNGLGYCVLGSSCTEVDPEFHPDDNKGHCQDMSYKVTPYTEFVCCIHVPLPYSDHNDLLTWGDQGNGTWNLPPLVDGPLDLAPTQLEEVDDTDMVTLVINGQTFIFSSETFGSVKDPMELFQLLSSSLDSHDETADLVRETVHKIDEIDQKLDEEEDDQIYSDVLSSQEQDLVIENDKFTFDGLVVGSFRRRPKPLRIKMPPIQMMPDFLLEEIQREKDNEIRR